MPESGDSPVAVALVEGLRLGLRLAGLEHQRGVAQFAGAILGSDQQRSRVSPPTMLGPDVHPLYLTDVLLVATDRDATDRIGVSGQGYQEGARWRYELAWGHGGVVLAAVQPDVDGLHLGDELAAARVLSGDLDECEARGLIWPECGHRSMLACRVH